VIFESIVIKGGAKAAKAVYPKKQRIDAHGTPRGGCNLNMER